MEKTVDGNDPNPIRTGYKINTPASARPEIALVAPRDEAGASAHDDYPSVAIRLMNVVAPFPEYAIFP